MDLRVGTNPTAGRTGAQGSPAAREGSATIKLEDGRFLPRRAPKAWWGAAFAGGAAVVRLPRLPSTRFTGPPLEERLNTEGLPGRSPTHLASLARNHSDITRIKGKLLELSALVLAAVGQQINTL